jgi:cell division protein FtsI (penicillin-binding protein 3)
MVAILLVFSVLATATGLRLGYWQVIAASELAEDALQSMGSDSVEMPPRADILDRDGVVMAQTASYDVLVAYPSDIEPEEREGIIETLGGILGLDAAEREVYLAKLSSDAMWASLDGRISHKESAAVVRAVEAKLLPGIGLDPQDVRIYQRSGGQAETTLASQIIGFVRADGRGGEGVERLYDDRLTTVDPDTLDLASVDGIPGALEGVEPPPLELTLDAKLQKQVEKELNTARIANKAKSASAIVMDPYTGTILAAASVPGYDANEYAKIAAEDISRLRNPIVSDQYEPGSVMKIFTVTAALDAGVVTPNSIIDDAKQMEFFKYTVRNADHKSKGSLAVKDVIALSRNVATAKIARRLGSNSNKAARKLHGLWEKVGMAGKTGVDIANEAAGSWCDPGDGCLWSDVDLANRAFGQGVSVTLVQLATGVSTLVNGGYRVQPHIVDGGEASQVEKERVLRVKVAKQAKDILNHVTGSVPWYAKGSLIPGYEIGGKTGTAQIWDSSRGQWKQRRFNHSFVGYIAGRRQEVVIAVRLEEPKPLMISQGVIPLRIESYELFQMVARAATKQLDMKRSKVPRAGKPIAGTDAARQLDPIGNREAIQQARRAAGKANKKDTEQNQRKADSKTGKAGTTEKAKRSKDDGIDVAAAPKPAAGASNSDDT